MIVVKHSLQMKVVQQVELMIQTAVNSLEMEDVNDMTIHEKGVATECSDDMDSEQNEFPSIHSYHNLENG